MNYWAPVDQYIGGIEHAVLHLLYARFFTKVLRDLGHRRPSPSPSQRLLTQGMVVKDGAKMSKSKGNVVDPDDMIAKLRHRHHPPVSALCGAARTGPRMERPGGGRRASLPAPGLRPDPDLLPDIKGVSAYRGTGADLKPEVQELRRKVHQAIQKVTEDIEERFHFNTAIATVMELVNTFYLTLENLPKEEPTFRVWREGLETLVKLLNPMVPHLAEELWQALGYEDSLQLQPWPQAQPEALVESVFTLVVQVDGKVRSKIEAPVSATEEQLKQLALQDPSVQKWLKGEPRRVVLARGKLINIVT